MGVDLYFMPPGTTDEFQPLDRLVFAALKPVAKKLFHRRLLIHMAVAQDQKRCRDLPTAWEALPLG
jgi:hypothetical protein